MRQARTPTWQAVLLLFVVTSVLAGCADLGHQLRYAAEDFIDMQAEPSGIYTVRMGRWTTDVSADTRLEVDARHDYQVQLVTGDTRLDLGKLQQQLPDTPVKTMFLDTGTTRFILGWVDDEVEGTLRYILITCAISDDELLPIDEGTTIAAAITPVNGSRFFVVPLIDVHDLTRWADLKVIGIYTSESAEAEKATGHRWAVRKEYLPPLATKPLYQRIELPAP